MFLRVAVFIMIFFFCSGMKLVLKDGNFIEIQGYKARKGKIYFKKNGRIYYFPESLINKQVTRKLYELESKKIAILKQITSLRQTDTGMFVLSDLDSAPAAETSEGKESPIKLEMLDMEDKSFFLGLDAKNEEQDNVVDKMKKKGFMFKFQIPVQK